MNATENQVWLNGSYIAEGEASVSILDRGFLYGDGVFETIRAEKGKILFLDDHLDRLGNSLSTLRIDVRQETEWRTIIEELLARNGLGREIAAVKIVVTRGVSPGLGMPSPGRPALCATARRYDPPADAVYARGWALHVAGEGFSPPLSMHKSLNYLYFLFARQAALDAGADEALILDPFGCVTETSTGCILARTEGMWWTPESAYQLPGITLDKIIEILAGGGRGVTRRPARVSDFVMAETVWVLNSLMGIMPVYRIGEKTIPHPAPDEASMLRGKLFGT